MVKEISSAVYRIQDQRTSRCRRRIVVHFDRLKRCTLDMWVETALPSGSTPHPLVGQQTGPERALPPGTNMQYLRMMNLKRRKWTGRVHVIKGLNKIYQTRK